MSALWIRLAAREIRNNRRFSFFFAFNLALGLLGFVLLDSFKAGFGHALDLRSRNLLSADLAVSSKRRFTPGELGLIRETLTRMAGPGVKEGNFVSMLTMARNGERSRLVELDGIDPSYPFYGQLELNPPVPQPIRQNQPEAWIYPELGIQLGVRPGDSIELGNEEFKVAALVVHDTANAWRGFSLATRVYVGLPLLEQTGLMQKGSTVSYTRFFALPPGATGEETERIARELNHRITDPRVQIKTHRQASEEVGKVIDYLDDFLGLVAIVALFLSAIGAVYLFRSYLAAKLREIAILESLGAGPRDTRKLYLIQLSLLGLLSAALALVASLGVLPLVRSAIQSYLPFPITLSLSLHTALVTLLLGAGASLLICLPLLYRLQGLKPADLFSESADPKLGFSRRQGEAFLPALVCFWGLSVWQAHSWKMGSLFFALSLGSALALAAFSIILLGLLPRLEPRHGFVRRSAARGLHRSRLRSIAGFVGIGMGALLLNVIPEIQANIHSEFTEPAGMSTPSLFLFDIQPEQRSGVEHYLKAQGIALNDVSPLIRSRLDAINGQPFEKEPESAVATREQEEERRFRNRGFNLSYRDHLQESESLYAGRFGSAPYVAGGSALPEISLEHRFADRLKIKLGDTLDFDVEGIPVRGKVTSLRKIRWTSFQPNFFVLFQPGVLEEAPKTFIATLPALPLAKKIEIQGGLVEHFPNVSMVDLTELVTRVLEIFRQMGLGIQAMSILTILAGFVVLFSIANHQASTRSQESNLLKILGARFADIQGMIQVQFGILGLSAALIGTVLSYGVAYIISVVVFEGVWVFTWRIPLVSIVAVTLLSVVTATIATRRVLRRKPIELLG